MDNAKRFYDGTEMIINAFENKMFPLYHDHHEENRFEDEDEDDIRDGNGLINYKNALYFNFPKRKRYKW